MSSSPSEPENAAPAAAVRHGQEEEKPHGTNQDAPRRWANASRTSSTSLLTQALAANQEAEEHPRPVHANHLSPVASTMSFRQLSASNESPANSGVKTGKDKGALEGRVTMGAPGTSHDDLHPKGLEELPISTSVQLNGAKNNVVESRLTSYRDLFNNNRGRGTSLERTEKEKRVQESPKGTHSTNPGDTALPPSPAVPNPTALDSISSNQPTEGVRARYRSWRDSRHGMPPEKAWSIGEVGTDDIMGGQVEKSIKDAMAGIEPNNRSRKASHSLRFFKEGLPETSTKRREGKSRGHSKDGPFVAKQAPLMEALNQKQSYETPDPNVTLQSSSRSMLGESSVALLHEKDTTRVASKQPGSTPESRREALDGEGYFGIPHGADMTSEEQVKTLPLALLVEIRNNHNLTPGAAKGSSFSRSIPVTESERSRPDGTDSESKPVEDDTCNDDTSIHEDQQSPSKIADDEDESGEEQISSALFVPHKTPHESPELERDRLQRFTTPKSNDQSRTDASESQEWLEEYAVPSRNVDQKYISHEQNPHPTPSPTRATHHSSYFEKKNIFSEPQVISDNDQGPASESGYTTTGDESSLADEHENTPTGSLKQDISGGYSHKVQDHEQVSIQPVKAIELIPYRHQVGGHTTMWRFSRRAVCKQLNNRENEFYEKIERYHPQLLKFLPR